MMGKLIKILNVFGGDGFGTKGPKSQSQTTEHPGGPEAPLLFSFLSNNKNAVNKRTSAKYTKRDAERQGHVFKEKTRYANCKDVFAQVTINFGDEPLGFTIKRDFHAAPFTCSVMAKGGGVPRQWENGKWFMVDNNLVKCGGFVNDA